MPPAKNLHHRSTEKKRRRAPQTLHGKKSVVGVRSLSRDYIHTSIDRRVIISYYISRYLYGGREGEREGG